MPWPFIVCPAAMIGGTENKNDPWKGCRKERGYDDNQTG